MAFAIKTYGGVEVGLQHCYPQNSIKQTVSSSSECLQSVLNPVVSGRAVQRRATRFRSCLQSFDWLCLFSLLVSNCVSIRVNEAKKMGRRGKENIKEDCNCKRDTRKKRKNRNEKHVLIRTHFCRHISSLSD
jgi:hypothetical protein